MEYKTYVDLLSIGGKDTFLSDSKNFDPTQRFTDPRGNTTIKPGSNVHWRTSSNQERIKRLQGQLGLGESIDDHITQTVHPSVAYVDLDGFETNDQLFLGKDAGEDDQLIGDALRRHVIRTMDDGNPYVEGATEEGADTIFGDEISEIDSIKDEQTALDLMEKAEIPVPANASLEDLKRMLKSELLMDFSKSHSVLDSAELQLLEEQFSSGTILVKGTGSKKSSNGDQSDVSQEYVMGGQIESEVLSPVEAFDLTETTLESHTGIAEDGGIQDPWGAYLKNELEEATVTGESDLFAQGVPHAKLPHNKEL